MKIFFICGGLAPGKNGVGDYSRRLGAELIKRGHQVELLSLYDPDCDEEIEECQVCDGVVLKTLRLPRNLSWSDRRTAAKRYVEAFDPDWVSLQFVCYSFHEKGLCFGIGSFVRSVIGRRKLHLMVHELWIGIITEYSLKHRFLGFLQKLACLKSFSQLDPTIVHTQLENSREVLTNFGVKAELLPLFSNIPVLASDNQPFVLSRDKDERVIYGPVNVIIKAGFFGRFGNRDVLVDAVDELSSVAKFTKRKLILFSAGRISDADRNWWHSLSGEYPEVTFILVGELDELLVSSYLKAMDFCVAATPAILAGKSGAIAAYLEHELPVYFPSCTRKYYGHFTYDAYPSLLIFSQDDLLSKLESDFLVDKRETKFSQLEWVVDRFISSLSHA